MQISRKRRFWYLVGPIAALLFAIALVGFAAIRDDGYSHATKAVSELGSTDAPNAVAFNLMGFIVPGVLIMLFSAALLASARSRTGPFLLLGSGLMLTLAGLAQADVDDSGALTTQLHALGAVGSGALWLLALFWLGRMLRSDFGFELWGRATPWFAVFLVTNIGWQIAFQTTGLVMPGWGQRIGFLGYFLWIAITGLLLWHSASGSGAKEEG